MNKLFVVSDIHGFYDELIDALEKEGFNKKDPAHILMVLGDCFDRGPQAVQLFEFLKELREQNRLMLVKGNHEELLAACIREINENKLVGHHNHYSNKTVDTINQIV